MTDFFRGVGDFFRSFTWWRRRPGVMALGLVPAFLSAIVLIAAIVGLSFGAHAAVIAVTPFAEEWAPVWRDGLRAALLIGAVVGSIFLALALFVTLTLALGDPFYEKIWASIEAADGGPVPDGEYGFWRGLGDSIGLLVRGIGVSLIAALAGFVPVVGVVLGPFVGALLGGRVLADELTSRALTHRGLTAAERRALTAPYSARLRGFGAAAALVMLVPFLSIVVMPTAVAGSTIIARRMLGLSGRD